MNFVQHLVKVNKSEGWAKENPTLAYVIPNQVLRIEASLIYANSQFLI